jgi:N-acetylglutamate synthase-like GNAT family acetyltransferase
MTDLTHIEISLACADDLAAVQSFYSSVDYGCGLRSGDRVLVAKQARSIVAAVRLSSEADTLVLRGMYVAEPLRGAGIGSKLLERTSSEIGSSACWCIPYVYLERFYSRIGFHVCENEEVPEFLAVRKKRYVSAGREVTIMNKSEGSIVNPISPG